ncbi:MAG: nitroreductase family protein [Eggerthellaceae bacterium]|nr:nitroreductase family protein [Eggerthellaceae bacterium]
MDAIFERASVRQYSDQPVTDHEVDRLLRAAMAAPSAGNQQPWEFYVTRNPALAERLAACSPYAVAAKHAPCVIVACVREEGLRFASCAPLDMGACIENLLLEAVDAGLGAVWMALYPDDERVSRCAEVLKCDGVSPFALIAVGHPAEAPVPRGGSRYDAARVHWMDA